MAAKVGRPAGSKKKPKETTLESFGVGKDTEMEMEMRLEKIIKIFRDEIIREMREEKREMREKLGEDREIMKREIQEERERREEERRREMKEWEEEKRWRIMMVYSQNVKETIDTLSERVEENEKEVNGEGRRLIGSIEERGWGIINGSKGEEGEWTYVGENGESVIDYAIGDQEEMEEIESLKIGERVELDHMPLEVRITGTEGREREEKIEEKEQEKREWNDETKTEYLKRCEGWSCKEEETEELWKEIKEKIEEAVPKIRKKRRKWKIGERVWHDKEWANRKREVRRRMREWRKGKSNREEYVKERKEYKEWRKKRKKKSTRE